MVIKMAIMTRTGEIEMKDGGEIIVPGDMIAWAESLKEVVNLYVDSCFFFNFYFYFDSYIKIIYSISRVMQSF
ncbi:hypothetical protein EB796_020661 [Bugula neritina]|uniref:Uncharacterized protein n=1 Tax=Bugula neritina TaxID=10212 RepID=A0A7J7J5L9_BUGNE|nr:hypothetical protein EB796_020661 [Bugula neritina]